MQCHTERRQTHLTSLRGAKWNYAVYFKVTHTCNIEIQGDRLHYHLALLSSMCSGISGTSFTGRIPFVKNQKIRQHYTTLELFRKTKYKLVGWCFKSNFDEHYQTRWCLNTMDKTKYCDILMSDTQTQLLFRNNSKSVHSQNTNITNKTIQNVTAANNLTNIHCQTVWTQYTGRKQLHYQYVWNAFIYRGPNMLVQLWMQWQWSWPHNVRCAGPWYNLWKLVRLILLQGDEIKWQPLWVNFLIKQTRTHACTHTRTHARTHARTHTHTHTHTHV